MTLILADDDPLVSAALKTILAAEPDIEVLGTAGDGDEAVALYRQTRPDLALFDIRMKATSGLDAAEQILREDPAARLLFLTTFSDDEYIMRALRLGAMGYILKQDFERIVPALRAAYSGQSVLGGQVVAKLPDMLGRADKTADYAALGIEPREAEIIELVAQGLSNREIAEAVFLGEGTVRNYLSVILEKLNLRDRTQLAVYYYRNR